MKFYKNNRKHDQAKNIVLLKYAELEIKQKDSFIFRNHFQQTKKTKKLTKNKTITMHDYSTEKKSTFMIFNRIVRLKVDIVSYF